MTDQDTAVIPVRTARHQVPRVDALWAYSALAERFGREQVHLLESAGGPAQDRRHDYIGFGVLLTVSVSRGAVRVEGVPAVRDAVLGNVRPLLAESGGELRLPSLDRLWPLLRAVRDSFENAGSAAFFRFGFLAHFAYDVAGYIERLPRLIEEGPDLPDVQLVLCQGHVISDVRSGESELVLAESPRWPAIDPADIS
ncbi:hypothetical protein K7G98_33385, partial [Saccharothrix sp. MB29]|nr:hypothetical protein [Saccharothrix sp. MB29]